MIYFPERINTISTRIQYHRHIHMFLLGLCTSTYSVHARILKPWRASLPWLPATSSSCHVFPLSPVWAQLTLFVPAWGTRPPSLQDGAPIHRVRAHSLTGIRNTYTYFMYNFLLMRSDSHQRKGMSLLYLLQNNELFPVDCTSSAKVWKFRR